ncbi:uncharacterized protein TNCV_2435731 [Trichonephila clavipes]|nr:uncharacterized protein TNCV_2435731 [Trichonephila clavipes]
MFRNLEKPQAQYLKCLLQWRNAEYYGPPANSGFGPQAQMRILRQSSLGPPQCRVCGGFTCRNCGGGDRGRVAIYRPFGEVSLSLNRTVTCMVLKANDRRTSCPCHDEFRGPRSDYVRQVALATTTTTTTINITNFIGCLCYYWDITTVKTLCCSCKDYSCETIFITS